MFQFKKIILSFLCVAMLASAPIANAGIKRAAWGVGQLGFGVTSGLFGLASFFVLASSIERSEVPDSLLSGAAGFAAVAVGGSYMKSGVKNILHMNDSKCFEHCQKEGLNKKIQEHNKKEKKRILN